MIFYQIFFGPYCKDKYDEAENLIEDYLSSLLRNGQIVKNYGITPWKGEIVAYVYAQGFDANRLKYHSQWGKERMQRIKCFFGQTPIWKCNEDFPTKIKTTWKDAPFLFFVTDFLEPNYLTPLVRGDNGRGIPLYRVPITDMERDYTSSWLWQYKAFDAVWISSGELEIQAYRILAEPDSECSKRGREICLAIEKATGVPTYFYLKRYYGRNGDEEKKRLCPCCGKSWFVKRLEKKDGESTPFWEFDFQCKKCRLVSHFAPDVNLRYAKIGEPRKEK